MAKPVGHAAPAPLPSRPCEWCETTFRPKFPSSNYHGGECATKAAELRQATHLGHALRVKALEEQRARDRQASAELRLVRADRLKVNLAKAVKGGAR
jgi:hypothetical protein